MLNMAEKVHAGNKITTHQNHATEFNYLSNAWIMSKGQLIRQMEIMQMEINRLMTNRINDLETIDSKNKKILDQQDEIIQLYARLNESSPLKITA